MYPVPSYYRDWKEWGSQLVRVLYDDSTTRNMPISFDVQLTPDSDTTTVVRPDLAGGKALLLIPLTAEAAAALPSVWQEVGQGEVVLHHDVSASEDRTFKAMTVV